MSEETAVQKAMRIAADTKAKADAAQSAQNAIEQANAARAASTPTHNPDGTPATKAGKPIKEKKAEPKLFSPKHKASRGVDPSLKTTWVPLDQTPEENLRLQHVAQVRNTTIGALCANILKEQIALHKEAFDADVAKYDEEHAAKPGSFENKLATMTIEQIEAFLAKQEAAMAALNAQLAAKKAEEASATGTENSNPA